MAGRSGGDDGEVWIAGLAGLEDGGEPREDGVVPVEVDAGVGECLGGRGAPRSAKLVGSFLVARGSPAERTIGRWGEGSKQVFAASDPHRSLQRSTQRHFEGASHGLR
jgi:hypothetical protein